MKTLRQLITARAPAGMDPRHVEAYMRVAHSTFDAMSAATLDLEVAISAECVIKGGPEMAERLARSFGL